MKDPRPRPTSPVRASPESAGAPPDAGAPPPVAFSWRELDRAHGLQRRAAAQLDLVASEKGWPVPFSVVRFLVLAHLGGASAFGLTPRRLASVLELAPPLWRTIWTCWQRRVSSRGAPGGSTTGGRSRSG